VDNTIRRLDMSHRLGRRNALLLGFVILLAPLAAAAGDSGKGRFCSATAAAAFDACQNAARDDLSTALGVCTNVSDHDARDACISDAKDAKREGDQLCKDQRSARRDVCDALGEARYEPSFDPADFDSDFSHLTHPNALFPLAIGNRWTYKGGGEVDTVKITSATKLISGVTCIVAHDKVTADGDLTEDTNDWFASAKSGDAFYCGEEAKQYESFDGDNPRVPELVGNEGSFKAGREGAQPGILMLANPTVGAIYRQEFDLGNAEDIAEVLSTTYAYGQNAELDQHVPKALAQLLCSGHCVVTQDSSPLEPDAIERKYFAPGIGDFLEIALDTGEVTQLVDCNFDARCAMLPTP
jgi:hypothetical protein